MAKDQIILNSFGLQALKPLAYRQNLRQSLPVGGGDYETQEVEEFTRMNTGGEAAEVISYLGTPVWADLTLRSDETTADELNIQTVLITVEQEKNITKTALSGRNGTVKEYISAGDYVISIRGAFVSPNMDEYPTQSVKQFLDLMELNTNIVVVSPFLQLFRVFNVVIENFSMEQLEGYQNVQPFQINCVSDEPIELIEDA